MRPRAGRHLLLASSLAALAACTSSTLSDAALAVDTDADFSATVRKSEFEGGNGPAGYYAQFDVWLAIPPSSSANAGAVVPVKAPVYIRRSGGLVNATAADIHVGDVVEVWHDFRVGYGAVQCPPGAPCYTATQVVIDR